MQDISVRNAISSDIPYLMEMDHGYRSDHVWQMVVRKNRNEISITFREVRLPRPMRVQYPRDASLLADEWILRSGFFVAEREGHAIGYIAFIDGPSPNSAWTTDIVVTHSERRQGVGTKLLQAGVRWGQERGLQRLYMEMQSKNYPAISLARKAGLDFVGYSDSYFPDDDIALFFGIDLG
jgi:GNAT superfamily N-acetyltransferase